MKSRLFPQTGAGFLLPAGHFLKVTDPLGEQVADLFCFDQEDPCDVLSSGRSIDENDSIHFTRGHSLYAHSGRALLEIVEDTCGVHDFLITPCSLGMFQRLANNNDHHPSCQENLVSAIQAWDLNPRLIGTTFNIFMNVPVNGNGRIEIKAPRSKAGDFVCFRAHRDLYVALTACSHEGTNNGVCKPIDYEILTEPPHSHSR